MKRQIKQTEKVKKRRMKKKNESDQNDRNDWSKKKREKTKKKKNLKRLIRSKRVYRKRLRQSSIAEDTSPILMNSTLQIENGGVRNPTPLMGGYVYPQMNQTLNFGLRLSLNSAHT